jgi:hypothetical protein
LTALQSIRGMLTSLRDRNVLGNENLPLLEMIETVQIQDDQDPALELEW